MEEFGNLLMVEYLTPVLRGKMGAYGASISFTNGKIIFSVAATTKFPFECTVSSADFTVTLLINKTVKQAQISVNIYTNSSNFVYGDKKILRSS